MMIDPPPVPTVRIDASGQIAAFRGQDGKLFSQADRDAFLRMPDGTAWFDPHRLDHRIERPRYRCDRLRDMGVLESTVIGTSWTSLQTFYRKRTHSPVPTAADGERENRDGSDRQEAEDEHERSVRCMEVARDVRVTLRQAHSLMAKARRGHDELELSGCHRLSETVAVALVEAHEHLARATEYLDSITQREV